MEPGTFFLTCYTVLWVDYFTPIKKRTSMVNPLDLKKVWQL